MVDLRFSALRARVYLDLVDAEIGALSPVQISTHLGISRSLVNYHIRELEKESFINRIDGHHCPQKYAKGPKSNLLDSAIIKMRIQIHGETVNPYQNPPLENQVSSTPLTVSVPTTRSHIDGRITFPVLKVGSFASFEALGHEIPLFTEKPYNDTNNVKRWKAKFCFNGSDFSLEFSESLKTGDLNLHVWPLPRRLTLEQVDASDQVMMNQVQDVANFISKHAGWRFGIASANYVMHHGLQDTPLADCIPQIKGLVKMGDVWIDHSPGNNGQQEPETGDVEKAKIALTLLDRTKKLEDGEKVTTKRIVEFNITIEELTELFRSLVELEKTKAEYETVRAARESVSMVSSNNREKVAPESSESSISSKPKDRRDLDYIG